MDNPKEARYFSRINHAAGESDRIQKLGGYGVDIRLPSMQTTDAVYWSDRGNSYVICADTSEFNARWRTRDGERVALFSINGIGEIRWAVTSDVRAAQFRNSQNDEEFEAVKHFGLTFIPWT